MKHGHETPFPAEALISIMLFGKLGHESVGVDTEPHSDTDVAGPREASTGVGPVSPLPPLPQAMATRVTVIRTAYRIIRLPPRVRPLFHFHRTPARRAVWSVARNGARLEEDKGSVLRLEGWRHRRHSVYPSRFERSAFTSDFVRLQDVPWLRLSVLVVPGWKRFRLRHITSLWRELPVQEKRDGGRGHILDGTIDKEPAVRRHIVLMA